MITSSNPNVSYCARRKAVSLLNILAPLGRNSGDPGLYCEVVNSSCSIPTCRWSAGGFTRSADVFGRALFGPGRASSQTVQYVLDARHCRKNVGSGFRDKEMIDRRAREERMMESEAGCREETLNGNGWREGHEEFATLQGMCILMITQRHPHVSQASFRFKYYLFSL